MKNLDDSKLGYILDIIIFILLGIIIFLLVFDKDSAKDKVVENTTDISLVDDATDAKEEIYIQKEEEPLYFMVDIKGAIKKPGVYKVEANSIVNDVIAVAGGLKSSASTKYINLAKKVSNEMVIMIYTNSEVNKMKNPVIETCTSNSYKIDNCEDSSIVISSDGDSALDSTSSTNSQDDSNKVSINTGNKDELMTLSGIGESKAIAIIEYRNSNGDFKSIEEIMNVSGIGESAYNKIKDNIKL